MSSSASTKRARTDTAAAAAAAAPRQHALNGEPPSPVDELIKEQREALGAMWLARNAWTAQNPTMSAYKEAMHAWGVRMGECSAYAKMQKANQLVKDIATAEAAVTWVQSRFDWTRRLFPGIKTMPCSRLYPGGSISSTAEQSLEDAAAQIRALQAEVDKLCAEAKAFGSFVESECEKACDQLEREKPPCPKEEDDGSDEWKAYQDALQKLEKIHAQLEEAKKWNYTYNKRTKAWTCSV